MESSGKKAHDQMSSYDKLEQHGKEKLFKFKAAAHAIISINRQKSLAFDKRKEKWGPSTANRNDILSGEIQAALDLSAPSFPGDEANAKLAAFDCREVFYTHDVAARPDLAVPCFDSLVLRFQRRRQKKARKAAIIEEQHRKREERLLDANRKRLHVPKSNDYDSSDEEAGDAGSTVSSNTTATSISIPKMYGKKSCPFYVIWEKEGVTPQDVFIRGKAGTMKPRRLDSELIRFALGAASDMNDLGYFPVRENELRRLKCVIEIPNPFETLFNLGDWASGVHGLAIR